MEKAAENTREVVNDSSFWVALPKLWAEFIGRNVLNYCLSFLVSWRAEAETWVVTLDKALRSNLREFLEILWPELRDSVASRLIWLIG